MNMETIQINKDIFTHLLNCYLNTDPDLTTICYDQLQTYLNQAALGESDLTT